MITSIRLQNFKAHRDTTVPLGRFTVLVGPNGAGKTSVLEALRGLGTLVDSRPLFERGQRMHDVQSRTSKGPLAMMAEGDARGVHWTFSAGFPDEAGGPVIDWTLGSESGQKDDFADELPKAFAEAFGTATLYHFDAQEIATATPAEDDVPAVSPNGSNTAAVLAAFKLGDDERFARIESLLHTIVPNVERIRIRRVRDEKEVLEKIHLDFRGAPDLPAHVVSDGTLMTLALLTAMCHSKGPRLLLLDDIDNSLHPTAQIELVRQLKHLLEELPETQIVATTHSPYILDNLDANDIHVFALRKDGTVATKRLSEHPDVPTMIGALSPGQIWTLDPEKDWVTGEGD